MNVYDLELNENVEMLLKGVHAKFTYSPEYKGPGYLMKVENTKFFSPYKCFSSYIMGFREDDYKTQIGDKRYSYIEEWLHDRVIPKTKGRTNTYMSSYDLKHVCEADIGGYVSNETIKFILAKNDVRHRNTEEEYPINVLYPMSSKINPLSPHSGKYKYRKDEFYNLDLIETRLKTLEDMINSESDAKLLRQFNAEYRALKRKRFDLKNRIR